MMVPLNNNSDTSTMPSGIDRDHLATTTESSDWNVPVNINGLDSGLNFPVNSVHDDINIKTSNPELDSADWPIRSTKRKLHSMDDISETGDICDLFFHQPAKKLSLLFNTKFRYKEERKRILKLSIAKLRQVDDPEVFLRRSVLINNTVRRLHKELREEKLNRSSRFLHATYDDNKVTSQLLTPAKCRLRNEDELTCTTCLGVNVLKDPCRSSTPGPQNKSPCKRPLETPNQQEPIKSKQAKQETTNEAMQSRCESEQVQPRFDSSSSLQSKERRDNSADRENSGVVISEIEKQYSQYSCGQSSIFGELQSVVFHSLIASLES